LERTQVIKMMDIDKLNLTDKSILLTGGTGSFGKKFTETILTHFPDIKRFVIFSRDELKQFEMSQVFNKEKYPGIRYILGDVRDIAKLKRAFEGIDIVVHAAALKQVPAAEYNPEEFIKTNIQGAENIVEACLSTNVKRVVALSTDKAAAPINLYGATKLVSDKLFIAANNIKGKRDLRFSVVRYGNVMGSRGSVIPFFIKKRKDGILPITHPEMTRFNISLDEGVNMVLYALQNALGGEIFVPKIPSYKILDVAEAIAPDCKTEIIGIRPGEKLHEEMITETDSYQTIEFDTYYAILPDANERTKEKFIEHYNAKEVPQGFKYNSGSNNQWLSPQKIRELIIKHLNPNFKV
jgi:UDP-N-acetylglucosamine 4,6-dehydratase (inverting)